MELKLGYDIIEVVETAHNSANDTKSSVNSMLNNNESKTLFSER